MYLCAPMTMARGNADRCIGYTSMGCGRINGNGHNRCFRNQEHIEAVVLLVWNSKGGCDVGAQLVLCLSGGTPQPLVEPRVVVTISDLVLTLKFKVVAFSARVFSEMIPLEKIIVSFCGVCKTVSPSQVNQLHVGIYDT